VARTGWHCIACSRYFQTDTRERPRGCRYCGAEEGLRRIDHVRGDESPPAEVSVGDAVAFETSGQTPTYVVGEVVETGRERLFVRARDGTGLYTVAPDQVRNVRERADPE
jgi:predicted  nucleic acid-binding Zn-ribbon protein